MLVVLKAELSADAWECLHPGAITDSLDAGVKAEGIASEKYTDADTQALCISWKGWTPSSLFWDISVMCLCCESCQHSWPFSLS